MDRRRFLKSSLAMGIGTALGTATGCGETSMEQPNLMSSFIPGGALPWTNWAANQSCIPANREAPASEDELVEVMKSARGVVRAVGGGHSFSAVVPTKDTLVATDFLSGLVDHDPNNLQATVLGGTRLNNLGPILEGIGQALPNMPDMDYTSLAGCIVNAVHGTGPEFGSMSAYVTGLTLATPSGELLECSTDKNPDVFQAARTSVGALGIISKVTLQNQASYDLTEVKRLEKVQEVLEDIEARISTNRNFELFAFPYTPMCQTISINDAVPGDEDFGEEDHEGLLALRDAFDSVSKVPLVGRSIYESKVTEKFLEQGELVRTGRSYRVFPNQRTIRFREMEYTIPAEFGPKCLLEILDTIRSKKLPLNFPLEYRYVKRDDIWLSNFEGRDGCSISVHQFGDRDYRPVFAEIEPIFWKYEGRPHWGKLHTLDSKQLANLYPRHWQDFQQLRRQLDPEEKMLNAHLRELFGS